MFHCVVFMLDVLMLLISQNLRCCYKIGSYKGTW